MIRLLLVLGVFVFFLLCATAMWRGYRNRAKRQEAVLSDFSQPPADLDTLGPELLPVAKGVYVSTTTDASWQDRVAIGDIGFRSKATLHLFQEGLYVARIGASPLWIPRTAFVEVRVGQGMAGKVMFGKDLLIIRWQLDEQLLDTGFLANDRSIYPEWLVKLPAPEKLVVEKVAE